MDRELLDLEHALREHPEDRVLRRRLALAAERAGDFERAVKLSAALLEDADDAERADLGPVLARLADRTFAVARLLDVGPTRQAKASMRALVEASSPAPVIAVARRAGQVRSLAAARALRPLLGEDMEELPSPPALVALADFERHFPELGVGDLLAHTVFGSYAPDHDDEYARLLGEEVTALLREDEPAWMRLAFRVIGQARLASLPWLDALACSWDEELVERAVAARERFRST